MGHQSGIELDSFLGFSNWTSKTRMSPPHEGVLLYYLYWTPSTNFNEYLVFKAKAIKALSSKPGSNLLTNFCILLTEPAKQFNQEDNRLLFPCYLYQKSFSQPSKANWNLERSRTKNPNFTRLIKHASAMRGCNLFSFPYFWLTDLHSSITWMRQSNWPWLGVWVCCSKTSEVFECLNAV